MIFNLLESINQRPKPFEYYTASELWTNEHASQEMLKYHLNEDIDVSSRNKKFIHKSIEWIIEKFNIKANSSIADFGCGPGLYTSSFAKRGKAKVTGIDFSSNSIKYARQTAEKEELKIDYICQNYLEFNTDKKFDLITMIMCDFCALSPEQRTVMLNKFHSFLKPDGHVLLDVYSHNMFSSRTETAMYEKNQLNNFWSAEDYYCFLNIFKYEKEKVILDKYTIIEPDDSTKTVYNWLQYFNRESLITEFRNCGFEIEEFYNDITGTPFTADSKEIAIAARKA